MRLIDLSKETENNESFCEMIERSLHSPQIYENLEYFLHYYKYAGDLYDALDKIPIFLVDTEQSGQVVNNIRVPNPERQKFYEGVFISDSLGIYKRNYSFQKRQSQSSVLPRWALWGMTNAQIFIWVDKLWNIAKEESTDEKNNFCILFYWTLLHELSHAIMDTFRDDITKNIDEEFRFCKEESLANAVSINLTVQDRFIRNGKSYLHNYIRNHQPFAYKLGMVYENTPLLEEAVKTWIMIKSGQTAIPAKNEIQDWFGIVKPFCSVQQYDQNLLLWYETNIFRQHQSQNKIDSVSGNEDFVYAFKYKGKICSDVMLVHKVISEFLICHPLITRKGLNDFFNLILSTNGMYGRRQEGVFCSTLFSPTKMNNRKGLFNLPLKCSDGKLYLQPSFFSVVDRNENIRCFLYIMTKLYMGPVIAFDSRLRDYIKSLQYDQERKNDDRILEEIRRIERKILWRINGNPFM